eukprot:361633-Chlamydomonas_euryale.AAC.2
MARRACMHASMFACGARRESQLTTQRRHRVVQAFRNARLHLVILRDTDAASGGPREDRDGQRTRLAQLSQASFETHPLPTYLSPPVGVTADRHGRVAAQQVERRGILLHRARGRPAHRPRPGAWGLRPSPSQPANGRAGGEANTSRPRQPCTAVAVASIPRQRGRGPQRVRIAGDVGQRLRRTAGGAASRLRMR